MSCRPLIRTRCNLLHYPFLNQGGKPEEEEEDVGMLKKKMEEARTEVESILQKSGQDRLALGSPGWLVGRHHAKNASHTRKCCLTASHRENNFLPDQEK